MIKGKEKEKEIEKIVKILVQLDKTGLTLMDSNANILKARQDLEETDSYEERE